jgi:hypothetical protein
MTPMQKIVADAMRAETDHDPFGVTASRAVLDTSYAWLERRMADREWAAGEFGLADCAAAPALFYADWAHPIDASLVNLREYRRRLLARPSVARAVEEARPFRSYFPLGAPDRVSACRVGPSRSQPSYIRHSRELSLSSSRWRARKSQYKALNGHASGPVLSFTL